MSEGDVAVSVEMERQYPTNGLPVFHGETWEEHVSQALVVKEEIEERLWRLAAIYASLTSRYGEASIPKFASEIGSSARRIYEMAATYKAWESRERSHICSFSHHTIAARETVIEAGLDPEALIRQAEDENLSTRELEQQIAEYRRVTQNREPETRTCPRCGGSGEVWT